MSPEGRNFNCQLPSIGPKHDIVFFSLSILDRFTKEKTSKTTFFSAGSQYIEPIPQTTGKQILINLSQIKQDVDNLRSKWIEKTVVQVKMSTKKLRFACTSAP